MSNQNIPQQTFQSSHELTPRDDNKKIVSEVLKRVDQLIRKGDLDHAEREIGKAKEIDPRNVYAFALEERIINMRKDIERLAEINRRKENIQPVAVKPTTEELPSAPLPKPVQADLKPAYIAPKKPLPPFPLDKSIDTTKKEREPQQDRVVDRSIELESYRKTLADMWNDGAPTEEGERRLNELRTLLEITDAEHEGIEKNVRRECYKNVIIKHLSTDPIVLSDISFLTSIQHLFKISAEEHVQIQTQLMNVIQHKQRNRILVVDDDTRLLELLAASLEDNGFDVTALSTSDEAYALLRKFVPDLILCDINLETSTMGGFTFYEKIQELEHIQSVPFIFLSGLTDEVLIRTGKELGVDDYLMKPISEQTLISTLKGKLKRFKQLKKVSAKQIPTMAVV
ncbi:MAG: response regulator [Bacteroidetes bacterium]|nr:response regulator [Bacteroidota bacterium]